MIKRVGLYIRKETQIMGNIDLLTIFDGLLWAGSFYCFYSCYFMYTRRRIHKNLLLIPVNIDTGHCKDTEGYIRFMLPRLLAFSAVNFLFGGLNLLSNFILAMPDRLVIILILPLLAAIFWFWYMIQKSVRLFW